jgi:hypothetical protein
MAGFDFNDITKKAQTFLNDDKVKKSLKSERAEDISDKVLDAVADAADKASGHKHSDQIHSAKAAADKKIGNQ